MLVQGPLPQSVISQLQRQQKLESSSCPGIRDSRGWEGVLAWPGRHESVASFLILFLFNLFLFIYLGCVGSSLLCVGFL